MKKKIIYLKGQVRQPDLVIKIVNEPVPTPIVTLSDLICGILLSIIVFLGALCFIKLILFGI